ncbi:MAG: 30S ribosomal protein S2 [Anaerolineales bacterium]|nr:30S ribosomal protein S2 [Anaerolineales bacterium]
MASINMKSLLESGVHFGHRTHRWNPYMKPYIFTERNGIHIIDLQQTVKMLQDAHDLVSKTVADGGIILFVGTKRQAQETIEMEANRAGMPYVTMRWLGGMLTNWRTMRGRINELERLERMRDRGEFDLLTKREALSLHRKIEKLETRFSGIRHMPRLPDMLFVVDIRREETAVREANILNIPVLAMVDTNCDPRNIDYLIPSNDDAIRAIKLVVAHMADAVLEGKAMRKDEEEDFEPAEVSMMASEQADELTDEELLGAATLAKMEAQTPEIEEEVEAAQEDVVAEAEAEAEAETTEEEPVTEAEEEAEAEATEEEPVAEAEAVAAEETDEDKEA